MGLGGGGGGGGGGCHGMLRREAWERARLSRGMVKLTVWQKSMHPITIHHTMQ